MDRYDLYKKARTRVKLRKKFYAHVLSWVCMSVFFIMINLLTADYFWAIFPILGWGIGVAFHGIRVFSDEWEDNEIEKELEKLKHKNRQRHGEWDPDLDLDDLKDLRKEWNDKDFV